MNSSYFVLLYDFLIISFKIYLASLTHMMSYAFTEFLLLLNTKMEVHTSKESFLSPEEDSIDPLQLLTPDDSATMLSKDTTESPQLMTPGSAPATPCKNVTESPMHQSTPPPTKRAKTLYTTTENTPTKSNGSVGKLCLFSFTIACKFLFCLLFTILKICLIWPKF